MKQETIDLACAGLERFRRTGDGLSDSELAAAIECLKIMTQVAFAMGLHPVSGHLAQELTRFEQYASARKRSKTELAT